MNYENIIQEKTVKTRGDGMKIIHLQLWILFKETADTQTETTALRILSTVRRSRHSKAVESLALEGLF